MQTYVTTPFGRRPMTLALVAAQAATKEFTTRSGASDLTVHKWRLFRALTEAKIPLGVTDRDLSVLNALLSFHQETMLTLPTAEKEPRQEDDELTGIIVFPSNRELSIRAHGMAPTTLRRHLAALVDAGLIIRRDSPNGKRYARRGQGGAIASAFGFDLTPLVARADEIENLAEEVRAENKAIRLLRERITLSRRDIVKMIATGIEEGVPGDWEQYHTSYAALSGRYARNSQRQDLEELATALRALAAEIQNVLETHLKEEKMAGNDSQNGRHIQYQNRNLSNLEPGLQEGRAEPLGSNDDQPGPCVTDGNEKADPAKTLPARHGARGLSRYRRLRERRDQQLARPRGNGGNRAFGSRRVAARLGAGSRDVGRARRFDRDRGDPAAGRRNQKRRRLSQGFDRESEGRGVLDRAGVDGAVARKGRKSRARAEGGRMNSDLQPNSLKIFSRKRRLAKSLAFYLHDEGINSCPDC